MATRLEPYRPRCRAGIGTLVTFHQVAGRFAGPEPSAPLWILLLTHYRRKVTCGGGSRTIPCSMIGGARLGLPVVRAR